MHSVPSDEGIALTSEENSGRVDSSYPCSPNANTVLFNAYKWGLCFDGRTDPLIEEVEKRCDGEGCLLPFMPLLLKGRALLWYRNYRHRWNGS